MNRILDIDYTIILSVLRIRTSVNYTHIYILYNLRKDMYIWNNKIIYQK